MSKDFVSFSDSIKTPPMSQEARRETGLLLRALQEGDSIGMPLARPMPGIGPRCLELRVNDTRETWRIVCRCDPDALIVLHVFKKKTQATPKRVLEECRKRLRQYIEIMGGRTR